MFILKFWEQNPSRKNKMISEVKDGHFENIKILKCPSLIVYLLYIFLHFVSVVKSEKNKAIIEEITMDINALE